MLPVTHRFSQEYDAASRAGLIGRKWLLPPKHRFSEVDSRLDMAYFQLTGCYWTSAFGTCLLDVLVAASSQHGQGLPILISRVCVLEP